jgi:molecular chaperone GrpE (heat shock protein)
MNGVKSFVSRIRSYFNPRETSLKAEVDYYKVETIKALSQQAKLREHFEHLQQAERQRVTSEFYEEVEEVYQQFSRLLNTQSCPDQDFVGGLKATQQHFKAVLEANRPKP